MKRSDLSKGQRRWFNTLLSVPVLMLAVSTIIRIGEEKLGWSFHGREAFAFSFFLTTILAGFVFWFLREVARAFYGGLELIFALIFIYFTIFVQLPKSGAHQDLISTLAQLGGSLYVFVRGLDNLNQGLKDYSKVLPRWRWLTLAKLEKPKPVPVYPWTRKRVDASGRRVKIWG
ncbi:hypothetical protein [Neorhizobium sp. DAR64872/K0K18]|uniref:hypothetical protein n=1 Tax=Neorhizobium sp. DAR64872/K0K18 TaxID=3421958 RepID=UPI003D2D1E48